MHAIYGEKSPGLMRLILAKDFCQKKEETAYIYEKTFLERIGHVFQWTIGSFLDYMVKNFRKPLFIVSLTTIVMFGITIAFYHLVAYKIMITVFPLVAKVEPWMMKAFFCFLIQATVFGVFLRTMGRLSNKQFMEKYTSGNLEPLYIGSIKLDKVN